MKVQAINGFNTNSVYSRHVKNDVNFEKNRTPEEKALRRKKWGVGLSSFAIPGAGQLVNGDGKKAGLFLGLGIPLTILSTTGDSILRESLEYGEKLPKGLRLGAVAVMLGSAAVRIFSIVDAVKNVKPNAQ